jgi:signal transduction histidine kinase
VRAVVRVQDTGIGIPPEDLPHLFRRFHRGRNAAAYPGSGLGLAIVRAIVERNGGTVEAEAVERGARFVLRLPLQGGEATSP